uniref:Uncharacterized protein n=1 Tax=uncultured Gemmatimonadetes bacterium Rifle_16ft_4_minimus_7 TaxID=1665098 RepID=A0A0H4TCM0_9BACT|nr:hypothetical protein [uncultured Gemmatimonadetes bacterium Rifle_16ft_4_minimus_7]
MRRESDLEAEVERHLREAKVKYVKEPVVGKTRPDFLVTTENGDQIVVEVKAWEPSPDATARAINQAHRYKELSKAAAALIVTAVGSSLSFPGGGVVPVSAFVAALSGLTSALAEKRSRRPVESRPSPKKKVFASMPFSSLAANASADRVDHTGRSGDVVQQIKEMIKAARIVVADLSESRANVCHEVGYAEALGRPVVQICSTPLASLPFNLRNNQTIQYSIGQASRLKTKLEKELRKGL